MTTTYQNSSADALVGGPCDGDVPVGLDFSHLVRTHGASLYRYARHSTAHHAEACDLLQDAYERGLRAAPAGLSDRHALGWMLVVMRNLRLDSFRRQARRPQIFPVSPDRLAAAERREARVQPFFQGTEAEGLDAPGGTAWEDLDSEDLRRAVRQLSPRLRQVYELHAFEGLAYLEIAERLRVPRATVGTRLRRARQKLREILLRGLPC